VRITFYARIPHSSLSTPHSLRIIVAVVFAWTCVAPSISAQSAEPRRVRPEWSALSAGPFVTPGDLWGISHLGYQVGASAGLAPARSPLGVRLEAAFLSATLRTRRGVDESAAGDLTIYSASLAPLVYFRPGANLRPYVFATGGMGRAHLIGLDSLGGALVPDRLVTRPIFGAGVGVRLRRGSLGGFVEARYQRMTLPAVVQLVPVIIGIEL
jgi:hypothetical protein